MGLDDNLLDNARITIKKLGDYYNSGRRGSLWFSWRFRR